MSSDTSVTRFRNVFILCTGRSGSQTFERACGHFTNYSAGHETLSHQLGSARMDYPAGHIEADNRLSWFLGKLEQRFGDDAFYVHLKRDPAKVAASYDRRWHHRYSLIYGYNRSLLMQSEPNRGAAEDLVETITANIEVFLADKTHVIEIDIDQPEDGFRAFADLIGATGDLEAAVAEFSVQHNQSRTTNQESTVNPQYPEDMLSSYQALKDDFAKKSELLDMTQSKFERERAQRIDAQRLLKKQKEKFKRFKFWAIILALPMILLLSPILIPLVLVRRLRGKRDTTNRKKKKLPVYDAYAKRQDEGPQAAIAALEEAKQDIPAGTIALFRAIDAESDDRWLTHMNEWASARGLPAVSLSSGDTPRFQRISFAAVDPVEAPEMVTVIIPCFNAENAVRQAIQSILNQSWRNLEVIAVNDASPDGTGAVLDQMATEDSRLRVLHNSINVGPYVSKNRALALARGAYVTGHDSDDIALPDRIAQQMASLQTHQGAKATLGYMVRLTASGGFTTPEKSGARSFDGIARLCPISNLCETATLREVFGGWDSVRFGADSELIERMELVLGGQFVRSDTITMLCLSDDSNLTNHPETGINTPTGLSPVRRAYKEAFQEWHMNTPQSELHIPFPQDPRKFDAPEKMRVPADDVRRLIASDS